MWEQASKAILKKPKKYRAPSWSWASLDGQVSWMKQSRNEALFGVLDLSSNNTKLEPSANPLVVSALLISATGITPGLV